MIGVLTEMIETYGVITEMNAVLTEMIETYGVITKMIVALAEMLVPLSKWSLQGQVPVFLGSSN